MTIVISARGANKSTKRLRVYEQSFSDLSPGTMSPHALDFMREQVQDRLRYIYFHQEIYIDGAVRTERP